MSLLVRAMFTGSRFYGQPTKDSDLDLVLLVTRPQMELLIKMSDTGKGVPTDDDDDYMDRDDVTHVRYGRLNLLVTTNPVRFACWEKGTAELMARKPVTRDEAVERMREIREIHNVTGRS